MGRFVGRSKERSIPSTVECGGEVWCIARHGELHVSAGFVEEVADWSAGDYVGCCWAAGADGGFEDFNAAVLLELLGVCVSSYKKGG